MSFFFPTQLSFTLRLLLRRLPRDAGLVQRPVMPLTPLPHSIFIYTCPKKIKTLKKRQQQQRNIFLLQIVCTRLFTALKFLFKKKIFLLRHWSAAAAFCLDSENRVIRFPPTSFHDEIDFFPFLNGAAFKWRISR